MTIDGKLRDEKLKYNTNKAATKISALSLGKLGKYEHLTIEVILPPNQHRIMEEAKFTYLPLGKTFERQTKIIEGQGKNQVETLKVSDFVNKINKQKQVDNMFAQNQLNILINDI